MKRLSVCLAVAAGFVFVGANAHAQSPDQRLELDRKGQTIVLEPYAPNVLRVTLSLQLENALAKPGYGFAGSPDATGWTASQTEQADVYKSRRIVATVERAHTEAVSRLNTQLDIAKFFNGSTPG